MSVFTVTAIMVALAAAPALAQDLDGSDFTNDELLFVEQDSALFDALCSPLVDINLAGCIFSDEDEEVNFFGSSEFDGFVQEIEVDEGDVEITDTFSIDDSIVQNSGTSVFFGDENENFQSVSESQNAFIDIDGNENEVEVEQDLEQNGFSPEVSTESEQFVVVSS